MEVRDDVFLSSLSILPILPKSITSLIITLYRIIYGLGEDREDDFENISGVLKKKIIEVFL